MLIQYFGRAVSRKKKDPPPVPHRPPHGRTGQNPKSQLPPTPTLPLSSPAVAGGCRRAKPLRCWRRRVLSSSRRRPVLAGELCGGGAARRSWRTRPAVAWRQRRCSVLGRHGGGAPLQRRCRRQVGVATAARSESQRRSTGGRCTVMMGSGAAPSRTRTVTAAAWAQQRNGGADLGPIWA
jgi:hypothetical protein